jgi:hypothetical protein
MSEWGISFRHGRGRQLKDQLLRYVRRNGLLLHEAGELAALVMLLSFPHEYLAARAVSRATKARLVHLGRNRDSQAGLGPLLKGHWDEQQLGRLAATGRQLSAKLSYQRQRALNGDTCGVTAGSRDRRFARTLQDLLSGSTTVSAVLGWEHVTSGVEGNVRSLLSDRNPTCYLVVDGRARRPSDPAFGA